MKTSLKPGMTLQGRYKILAQIGKGGMGFVYKVYGLRLNKELALKEMYDHFVDAEDRERVARQFQNEAETMAKLDHPGIPRILDTFEESERHYLVMEYVDGRTLEQVVLENPQYIMEHQMLEWMEQVLDIMEYLHNRPDPVIIRDLKPANVMLGNDGKIKVIDFGIAKIFDPRDRTQTAIKGSGSAGFAPPEQYGSGGTDPRSDIYALGVTLYYLLTKVIIADSVDRILQGGKVNPPSHYNPLVSEAVDGMILKMTELKPDDRFQSVGEIVGYMEAHNLRQAQSPLPLTGALPVSTLPRTAVRLGNQDVVEDWKKRQSQVSLTRPAATAGPPTSPGPALQPPQAPPVQDRDYHFVSEALLKTKNDKKQEKKGIPSAVYTGGFVLLFLFMTCVFAMPFIFKPKPSPTVTPAASVTTTTPSPEVETLKQVSGTITQVEKLEESVHVKIKSPDGPLTLSVKRGEYPKKAKVGAQVKADYKVASDGSGKPPWPVVSMSVTKSAPAPAASVTPAPQTPAYQPPQQYYPPQSGTGGYSGSHGSSGGYSSGSGYSGGGSHGSSSSGSGSSGSSGGSTGSSGNTGSGGLTHKRPTY